MGRIDIFKVDNKFDERERGGREEREALAKNPHSFALLRFFFIYVHLALMMTCLQKVGFFYGVYKIKNRIREFYFTFKKIKIFCVFGENSI